MKFWFSTVSYISINSHFNWMAGFIEGVNQYLNILFSGIIGKLITALIILLIGFVAGRLIGRLIDRALHEIELDNTLTKANLKLHLEHFIATAVSYLIYFLSIITALNQIGLTTIALYIIVGGAVILILIATALGIKDFIPNFLAGFFIYRKGLIKEGQYLIVQNFERTIKKISLVETQLETPKGDTIYIPNSTILKSTITIKN